MEAKRNTIVLKTFESVNSGVNNLDVAHIAEGPYVIKTFTGKTAYKRAELYSKKLNKES